MSKLAGKLQAPNQVISVLAITQTLLEEANSAFRSLSGADQNALADFHKAGETSIGVTLHYGLRAANELIEALRPSKELERGGPEFTP